MGASALAGSALVKVPVEQQCSRYGLKGCPDLVEGVVLYLDGDQRAATTKLRRAASKNVPTEVKRFARAISVALPDKVSGEIVAILTGDDPKDGDVNGPSDRLARHESAPDTRSHFASGKVSRAERAQLSMAAQSDPLRLTTESVFPLRNVDKAMCEVGGASAVCVKLKAGPLVVTDAMTPPGCSTQLIIGTTNASGHFGWIAPTSSPGFHGARFLVRPDQWVVVAAPSASLDDAGSDSCYRYLGCV